MARGNVANREVRQARRAAKQAKKTAGREFVEKFCAERQARRVTIHPKNENQELFLKSLAEDKICVGMGSAGTGKTFMAATHAANVYLQRPNTTIYIARPYVTMGNTVGLLPGEVEDKLAQFVAPLTSVLKKQLGSKYDADFGRNIKIQLVEAIRGLDLQDGILIVDEAQNLTIEEVKSITTRIGENAQIILIGDDAQTDLQDDDSGLPWFVDLVDRFDIPDIGFVEFGVEDIVRSGMVRDLIVAFGREARGE